MLIVAKDDELGRKLQDLQNVRASEHVNLDLLKGKEINITCGYLDKNVR